ncbi:MAG: hypothetical protein PHY50_07710 [Sideroxydans sp.]|nr:hypothetical protein [Sideroxydans sp.]
MAVRKAPEGSHEVTLRRWSVMEITTRQGTRSHHVHGHDVTHNFARTSSAIGHFDAHNMTVSTRSGRLYKLVGLPGNYPAGIPAWEKWCSNNCIVTETDVTDQYLDIDKHSTLGFDRLTRAALREENS